MRRRALLASSVFLFAAACGGSDSSSVTGTTGGTQTGPISATIDGKAWGATGVSASYKNNLLVFSAFELASGISLSVTSGVTAPGTYSLSFNNTNTGIGLVILGTQSWSSSAQGGTGSLTITTITANHVVGTFSFDAPPLSSATGTRHVTGGKIDATF